MTKILGFFFILAFSFNFASVSKSIAASEAEAERYIRAACLANSAVFSIIDIDRITPLARRSIIQWILSEIGVKKTHNCSILADKLTDVALALRVVQTPEEIVRQKQQKLIDEGFEEACTLLSDSSAQKFCESRKFEDLVAYRRSLSIPLQIIELPKPETFTVTSPTRPQSGQSQAEISPQKKLPAEFANANSTEWIVNGNLARTCISGPDNANCFDVVCKEGNLHISLGGTGGIATNTETGKIDVDAGSFTSPISLLPQKGTEGGLTFLAISKKPLPKVGIAALKKGVAVKLDVSSLGKAWIWGLKGSSKALAALEKTCLTNSPNSTGAKWSLAPKRLQPGEATRIANDRIGSFGGLLKGHRYVAPNHPGNKLSTILKNGRPVKGNPHLAEFILNGLNAFYILWEPNALKLIPFKGYFEKVEIVNGGSHPILPNLKACRRDFGGCVNYIMNKTTGRYERVK